MSKCSAGVNSNLGNGSFWVEIRDAKHVDRCRWISTWVWSHQLTSDLRYVYFFGKANGRVWKVFRCLCLSWEARGASHTLCASCWLNSAHLQWISSIAHINICLACVWYPDPELIVVEVLSPKAYCKSCGVWFIQVSPFECNLNFRKPNVIVCWSRDYWISNTFWYQTMKTPTL